jgi:hypothetical protein
MLCHDKCWRHAGQTRDPADPDRSARPSRISTSRPPHLVSHHYPIGPQTAATRSAERHAVAAAPLHADLSMPATTTDPTPGPDLRAVLRLVATGYNNTEIADRLFLSRGKSENARRPTARQTGPTRPGPGSDLRLRDRPRQRRT